METGMETDYHEAMKLENQLCFPLYAAARKITGMYTPFLKPLDLTYTQYIVLLVLWEGHEITVGELCRRLYLDSGTISPLLKKLESAGYVVRTRTKEDERVVEIRLTEAGIALQEAVKNIPTEVGSCVKLPPEKAGTLYALLYELLGDGTED
jgi:DNA-binding MarR family transcriptional regulator